MLSQHLQILMIEAVLFDCDGVILDSEDTWSLCEAEFLLRRGIAFEPERTKPLITGLGLLDSLRLLQEQYGFQGDLEVMALERSEIIRELFAQEVRLTEGFLEFFQEKVQGRYKTCIATSMAQEIFSTVDEKLGLSRLFDGRVYFPSHVGGRAKPAPDLFLYAAAQLETPPERCLVLEDSPRGIEAARRAGMTVVGLATTHGKEMLTAADRVVGSFSEIEI
ncbi:MAG TPA: HAD family phosphatase [Thermoanaerobaculia bacterium]|nr:HAD family phosphatase [Thermoanaerobaculia bacterium]